MKRVLYRIFGKFVRGIFNSLPFFDPLESEYLAKINGKLIPPLFIIGAPRSGSTLLYNLLTRHYIFSYITNLGSVFTRTPVIFFRLIKKFGKIENRNELKNNYGLTDGLFAPSEAGVINERWFSSSQLNKEFIRKSVIKLTQLMNGPYVNKNLYNSIRLKRISEVFPEAIFVIIKRNTIFNAQSIYLAQLLDRIPIANKFLKMLQVNNTKDSLKNAVLTVIEIEKEIKEFFKTSNFTVLNINYEDLKTDYLKQLYKVSEAYQMKGVKLELRNSDPVFLHISESQKLSQEDWNRLLLLYEDYKNSGLYS